MNKKYYKYEFVPFALWIFAVSSLALHRLKPILSFENNLGLFIVGAVLSYSRQIVLCRNRNKE